MMPARNEVEQGREGDKSGEEGTAACQLQHEAAQGVVRIGVLHERNRRRQQHDDRAFDQQRQGNGQAPRGKVQFRVGQPAHRALHGRAFQHHQFKTDGKRQPQSKNRANAHKSLSLRAPVNLIREALY